MCTYCITPLIQHACYMRYKHACYSNTRTTCTLHACYMHYQHACYSTLVQHVWYMHYHFQHPYNMHVTCTLFRIGKSDAFLDKSYRTTFKTKTKKRKRDIFFYVYLLFQVYARLVVLNWFYFALWIIALYFTYYIGILTSGSHVLIQLLRGPLVFLY